LNRLLIVAILLTSTVPLYAQRHQRNVAKLKADARNLVGIIGGDKTKTQAYCRILDLGRQLNQAVGDKDEKKLKALARQVKRLELPEFVASNVLKGVDLNSPDGWEIASIVQSLNQSCAD
jgi:hypothetical protein